MRKHSLAKGCVVAALMLGQAAPAMADADGLVGGVVGGIIGGIIVNEANKNKRTTTVRRTTKRTGLSSAQREANREVQVALNYFGYPVGTPDGVLGRQSRAGISDYQLTLGYTPTGQLTEYERTHLIGSYHRAIAGGAVTMQQAAANPMGLRGLLVTWRDEAAGITVPAVPQQGQMALVAEPPAALAPEAAPVIAATAPAADPANGGLPTFLGSGGGTQVSLASTCNKVAMMTTTNGGYTTVANMTDPSAALGEQFCLARSYAIATGEEMAAQVPGTTPAQIAEQCAGFAPAMKAEVAALSLQPADDVLAETRNFALSTGMSPAQLAATAKICDFGRLCAGQMDVAVGSA
ncbi:MAG: peptidoglycan-binding domain-containing protein [Defluviimonas denitrificans]